MTAEQWERVLSLAPAGADRELVKHDLEDALDEYEGAMLERSFARHEYGGEGLLELADACRVIADALADRSRRKHAAMVLLKWLGTEGAENTVADAKATALRLGNDAHRLMIAALHEIAEAEQRKPLIPAEKSLPPLLYRRLIEVWAAHGGKVARGQAHRQDGGQRASHPCSRFLVAAASLVLPSPPSEWTAADHIAAYLEAHKG